MITQKRLHELFVYDDGNLIRDVATMAREKYHGTFANHG